MLTRNDFLFLKLNVNITSILFVLYTTLRAQSSYLKGRQKDCQRQRWKMTSRKQELSKHNREDDHGNSL